jgi:hypothetical protein
MTVTQIKPQGVVVTLGNGDPPVSAGQNFSVYHNGVSLGQGVVRKVFTATTFKLNPVDPAGFNPTPVVGDTVQ